MTGKNGKATSPMFDITVRRVGLVSRDYNVRYPNGYRDFSYVLPDVLTLLDDKGCDTALFSLFSIIPRKGYGILSTLPDFANLKMIFLEEFRDSRTGRLAGQCVVYYRAPEGWKEYRFRQAFGRVNWQGEMAMVHRFAKKQLPARIIGNCCFIVCGESNGVKYDKCGSRGIIDPCGVRAAIAPQVEIVLNPLHDRMSRFEMMMKRQFLSKGGRWVISVWNRGKRDKQGRTKDGSGPAWTVYKNGASVAVKRILNSLRVEAGIIDLSL